MRACVATVAVHAHISSILQPHDCEQALALKMTIGFHGRHVFMHCDNNISRGGFQPNAGDCVCGVPYLEAVDIDSASISNFHIGITLCMLWVQMIKYSSITASVTSDQQVSVTRALEVAILVVDNKKLATACYLSHRAIKSRGWLLRMVVHLAVGCCKLADGRL